MFQMPRLMISMHASTVDRMSGRMNCGVSVSVHPKRNATLSDMAT